MSHHNQDLFRNALHEARKTTVWDKLNLEQKNKLVSRYIMQYYNTLSSAPTSEMLHERADARNQSDPVLTQNT